jgi:hypothetical protein
MVLGKLEQILASSRWRPYQLGALASLPVAAVMVAVWLCSEAAAVLWLLLYFSLAGLDVFQKTPMRKMISTALLLGTVVPLIVVMPMLYGSYGLRRP